MNLKRKFISGITIFIIIILILIVLFSNPDKIFEKNEKEKEPNIGFYNLNFTQNKKDYSYKINVAGDYGILERTSNIWIRFNIRDEVHNEFLLNDSYSLVEYGSTKNIHFKYITEQNLSEKPISELDGINLSLSITYFDEDKNNLLSVGDNIILLIKDIDKNEYFNCTAFRFYLRTMDDINIGVLIFDKPSTSKDPSPGDNIYPK